jgi:hypothetical protein
VGVADGARGSVPTGRDVLTVAPAVSAWVVTPATLAPSFLMRILFWQTLQVAWLTSRLSFDSGML